MEEEATAAAATAEDTAADAASETAAAPDGARDAERAADADGAQGAAQDAPATQEAKADANEKPEAPAKADAPARRRTLLEEADDPDPAKEGGDGGEAVAKDGGEALAKFRAGIEALDLGDGVRFDDERLSAIAPELMEIAGGDPRRAEPLVRKYVQGELARARAEQEAQDAFSDELRSQCRKRWGADTAAVARDANRGGRTVFGESIWNEMKQIESFANNPDIMERLAIVGRRFAEDGGAVHPAGQAPEDTRDVISRMYGGIR